MKKLQLFLSLFLFFNLSVQAQFLNQTINGNAGNLFGGTVEVSLDGKILIAKRAGINTSSFVDIYEFNGIEYELKSIISEPIEINKVRISDDGNRIITLAGVNLFRFGTCRLYEKNNDNEWKQIGKTISEEVSSNLFGSGFDYSAGGNSFVVGDPEFGDSKGEVAVYRYNGTDIELVGNKITSDLKIRLGSSVAITADGNRIAVGSISDFGNNIRIFDLINGQWKEQSQKIQVGTTSLKFFRDENFLLVGEFRNFPTTIYEFNGTTWDKNKFNLTNSTEGSSGWKAINLDITSDGKNILVSSINIYTDKTKFNIIDKVGADYFSRTDTFYTKEKINYFGIDGAIVDGGRNFVIGAPQNPVNGPLSGQVKIFTDEGKSFTYLNAYFDRNQNGVRDAGERIYSNPKFLVDTITELSAFDTSGVYANVNAGEHSFKILLPSDMVTVGDSIKTLDVQNDKVENIWFGIKYRYPVTKVIARPNLGILLCNSTVYMTSNIINEGTEDVLIRVEFNSKDIVNVNHNPQPLITENGKTIWEKELISGSRFIISQLLNLPNEDMAGKLLILTQKIWIINPLTNSVIDSIFIDQSRILSCAVDPNDKAVTPAGRGADLLTLKNQFLSYKIRFQNTGNYPAKDIIITDQLDKNFDYSTFELLNTSHPLYRTESRNGYVKFIFKDINLPDSVNNEPMSHGFVEFRIKPKKDVPENTDVFNKASIYFDQNKPIITNTTRSRLVNAFPVSTKDFYNRLMSALVFPNPTNDLITIKDLPSKTKEIKIYDVYGRHIFTHDNVNEESVSFSVEHLQKGLYVIKSVSDEQKVLTVNKFIKE